MNRKERLMRTLRGESVDRPAVNFYELNGLDEDPADDDPFNIYSDPSWKPLLELTREKTDRIVMRPITFADAVNPIDKLTCVESHIDSRGSRLERLTIRAHGRNLTQQTRRDPDVRTTWTLEPLLKNEDDLRAWISLPEPTSIGRPDITGILEAEKALGETGVVMIDTADPLCNVASLFDMATYTVMAMTENKLMHRALQKAFESLLPMVEAFSKALPGRLWRIYGPEYASVPFLPPNLFEEYVTRYVRPMVEVIHRNGGYARIHSHGQLKDILDHIVATGCDGLDPIEPPPQGDVELLYVRKNYGRQLVLFGNLEISDIENLPTKQFEQKVITAIHEGTYGTGRGFVLQPSAAPYGRKLGELTLRNYERLIEVVENSAAKA